MVPSDPLVTPSVGAFWRLRGGPALGGIRRNGIKVKLQDLPFRALTLLLSRPNEVLSREEFRQALGRMMYSSISIAELLPLSTGCGMRSTIPPPTRALLKR